MGSKPALRKFHAQEPPEYGNLGYISPQKDGILCPTAAWDTHFHLTHLLSALRSCHNFKLHPLPDFVQTHGMLGLALECLPIVRPNARL